VLADVENPSNHEVLSAAGRDAGRSCFGPEKRRLLFEDNSESNVGSRAPIKLLDLESREVRDLGATGTLKGCVWRADGSGFYFPAASLAGLTVSTFYDLESGEKEVFAQLEAGATVIPYGRKGRDSILVLSSDSLAPGPQDRPAFYFVDAQTGEYLTQIENEHLRFVPWEDPDRGGWRQGAFRPAYNDEKDLIVFSFGNAEVQGTIAVTNLNGSLFRAFNLPEGLVYANPRWGSKGTVFFGRKKRKSTLFQSHRVMVTDIDTGEVREFVEPETIDGAVALRLPDY